MPSSSGSPGLLQQPFHVARALLTDPRHFWKLAGLVILGDAILTNLIIWFIPYTEIDWETYMIQTEVYLKGQYDYSKISGPTGPLVYPAGHVRIHNLLYLITDAGKNVNLAQNIYGVLYLITLALTCAIYRQTHRVPNWIVLLLPFSKRLHSIFVLRLFNDCWAVLLSQLTILASQRGWDDTSFMLLSAAVSVKMNALLYLPGLLLISFKRRGPSSTFVYMIKFAATQVLLAAPFLKTDPWAYAHGAFDLGRVFLYKWTVNWRFLAEETFLDKRLALGLLIGHLSVLAVFGWFRWCNPDGGAFNVLSRGLKRPLLPAGLAVVTPDYVATVLFTSNLIGILFARSLHYQFYSWYAQQLPFLAWRTRYPVIMRLAILAAIEYAWNVFPSTTISSSSLLLGNGLLVLGLWFGHAAGISISKDVVNQR